MGKKIYQFFSRVDIHGIYCIINNDNQIWWNKKISTKIKMTKP